MGLHIFFLIFGKPDLDPGNAGLAETRLFINRRRSGMGLISQALLPEENGLKMLYYYEHQTGMVTELS